MSDIQPQPGKTKIRVYGIVDLVLCLDTTGSMSGVIMAVQENIAKSLVEALDRKMTKQQGKLDWRGRVIGYGDRTIGDKIYEGKFMNNAAMLAAEIKSIPRTSGSGSAPESSLDALYLASQSNWRQGPTHKVVILFTDEPTHTVLHAETVSSGNRDVNRIIEDFTKKRIKLFLYGHTSDTYDALETIPKANIQTWPQSEIHGKLGKMNFSREFDVMATTISMAAFDAATTGHLPIESLSIPKS